ncbi:MAG: site-specific tyrosine recombinase/integron integrase [Dehalococcoidia bacterium]|jgi:tyrosine recombinase XerC
MSEAATDREVEAGQLAEELLTAYLAMLAAERNRSAYTLRNYAADLRPFFAFLDEKRIDVLAADRHAVRAYLSSLMDAGVASGSIARKLSTLRSFYRFLQQVERIAANPCEGMRGPKQARRLPSFLSEEEVSALVVAPEPDTPQGLRNRALLELLYAAGVRVGEVFNLNAGDLELSPEGGLLRVRGKGNKQRVVLVGRPAARALKRYLRQGRPALAKGAQEALFLNRDGERLSTRAVQTIVRKAALAAGLDRRAHPHLLRHTFATHMLDGGADLRVVQELMGHANANTTQIYLHVTEARQRQVYDGAWDAMAESYRRIADERAGSRESDEQEEGTDANSAD